MTIKVGDRVKVEFEGTVFDEGYAKFRINMADHSSVWIPRENLTVIPKPIVLPTKKNALITVNYDDIPFRFEGGDTWAGFGEVYQTSQIQNMVDRSPSRYRVIFEGEDD